MSIHGVITAGDILLHAPTICSAFGPGVFLRAIFALAIGRETTFLALAWGCE